MVWYFWALRVLGLKLEWRVVWVSSFNGGWFGFGILRCGLWVFMFI